MENNKNRNYDNIHLNQNRPHYSDIPKEKKPKNEEEKHQEHHTDEDEIDLRDYINVLLKRKWQIAIIFGVAVVLAGIISFTMPLTFEASNLVEIGSIKGEQLQNLSDIKSVFSRETVLRQIRTKLQEPLELTEKTTTNAIAEMFDIQEGLDNKKSGFIEIKGRAQTPEKAVEVVNAVTDILLTYHGNIFVEAEKTFNAEMETIVKNKEKTQEDINQIKTLDIPKTEKEIKRLEQDIQKYEKEIAKRANIQSEGQGRIVESYINLLANIKNQKEAKEKQIINLKNKVRDFEQQLVGLNQSIQAKEYEKVYETKATEVEVPAIPPETRIAPKRKQNVMIAGILGIFIGVLYAFGAEYFSKEKA